MFKLNLNKLKLPEIKTNQMSSERDRYNIPSSERPQCLHVSMIEAQNENEQPDEDLVNISIENT